MTELQEWKSLPDFECEAQMRGIRSTAEGRTEEILRICRESAERLNGTVDAEIAFFQTCVSACRDILTSYAEAAETFLKQLPTDGFFQKTSATAFPAICKWLIVMQEHGERFGKAADPLFSALERLNRCDGLFYEAQQIVSAFLIGSTKESRERLCPFSDALAKRKMQIDRLREDVLKIRNSLFVWSGQTVPLLKKQLGEYADLSHRGEACDLSRIRMLCTEWIVLMRRLRDETEQFCKT